MQNTSRPFILVHVIFRFNSDHRFFNKVQIWKLRWPVWNGLAEATRFWLKYPGRIYDAINASKNRPRLQQQCNIRCNILLWVSGSSHCAQDTIIFSCTSIDFFFFLSRCLVLQFVRCSQEWLFSMQHFQTACWYEDRDLISSRFWNPKIN